MLTEGRVSSMGEAWTSAGWAVAAPPKAHRVGQTLSLVLTASVLQQEHQHPRSQGSGHEDSGVLLPSPRHCRLGRHTRLPSRQGPPLLYRASALLSDDARQELGLGPRRLHILSVLFANLCGKGGGEKLSVQCQAGDFGRGTPRAY